ncbi:thioredoxin H-type 2 isoform X1 [Sesamum indicum]|uniref:Thioredoxin H-type 2 isoform X1 n=1 Tax=Sesamum indicum TaxID=4182 RepID=A0A6I9UL61_SESIN|nr:thioredoxin H-type 2 isoform X1 [Sesamum indicum]XP_020553270.1 thioredoxin H-type 2 isoform X1 [Sesamum indicum]XP_020553271.1 thioredoxin H-type 2 isoform X1 [Sesamum indicum]XP_020553272.1 thioredoxin H-type 2 isoform X1 [Sesamum indicum]
MILIIMLSLLVEMCTLSRQLKVGSKRLQKQTEMERLSHVLAVGQNSYLSVCSLFVGMPSGPANVGYSFSVIPSSRSVDSLIKGMKTKVIANFSATWCGPCKMIAPYYVELSEKHPSIMFLTVDVDELTDFSTSWDIKATPTFFFLKDGQQFDKLVGANKPELQKKMIAILDSESPCQE